MRLFLLLLHSLIGFVLSNNDLRLHQDKTAKQKCDSPEAKANSSLSKDMLTRVSPLLSDSIQTDGNFKLILLFDMEPAITKCGCGAKHLRFVAFRLQGKASVAVQQLDAPSESGTVKFGVAAEAGACGATVPIYENITKLNFYTTNSAGSQKPIFYAWPTRATTTTSTRTSTTTTSTSTRTTTPTTTTTRATTTAALTTTTVTRATTIKTTTRGPPKRKDAPVGAKYLWNVNFYFNYHPFKVHAFCADKVCLEAIAKTGITYDMTKGKGVIGKAVSERAINVVRKICPTGSENLRNLAFVKTGMGYHHTLSYDHLNANPRGIKQGWVSIEDGSCGASVAIKRWLSKDSQFNDLMYGVDLEGDARYKGQVQDGGKVQFYMWK